MRLIRTILLLAGAGFLLPSPPEDAAAPNRPVQQVSTIAMLSSASSAFSDVTSFCVRQPGVCETAGYVAARLEAKAKYSVKLIYEWASTATSDPQAPPASQEAIKVDGLKTGTVRMAAGEQKQPLGSGQSTLKIEDLIPAWRGPVAPRKKQG